jgi:hypothetical protein
MFRFFTANALLRRSSSLLPGAVALMALAALPGVVRGQIFVANFSNDTVGSYPVTGGTATNSSLDPSSGFGVSVSAFGNDIIVGNNGANIDAFTLDSNNATITSTISLITSGISDPYATIVAGNTLYVANAGSGTVAAFTLNGSGSSLTASVANTSLVTGLTTPVGLAISGNNLYVESNSGLVGEYTLSGSGTGLAVASTVSSMIAGAGGNSAWGLALSGTNLLVSIPGSQSVQSFTLNAGGTAVTNTNSTFITGLTQPSGGDPAPLAVSGTTLLVGDFIHSAVAEYTLSGTGAAETASLDSSSFLTGVGEPIDLTFVIPEPATYAILAALGALGLALYRRQRR